MTVIIKWERSLFGNKKGSMAQRHNGATGDDLHD
jgi:hypothetical protein